MNVYLVIIRRSMEHQSEVAFASLDEKTAINHIETELRGRGHLFVALQTVQLG